MPGAAGEAAAKAAAGAPVTVTVTPVMVQPRSESSRGRAGRPAAAVTAAARGTVRANLPSWQRPETRTRRP